MKIDNKHKLMMLPSIEEIYELHPILKLLRTHGK